jgi:hypothetical protein
MMFGFENAKLLRVDTLNMLLLDLRDTREQSEKEASVPCSRRKWLVLGIQAVLALPQ